MDLADRIVKTFVGSVGSVACLLFMNPLILKGLIFPNRCGLKDCAVTVKVTIVPTSRVLSKISMIKFTGLI